MTQPIKITLTLSQPLSEKMAKHQQELAKAHRYLPYTDIIRKALIRYFNTDKESMPLGMEEKRDDAEPQAPYSHTDV